MNPIHDTSTIPDTAASMSDLVQAILMLKPTGPAGFEGFLACVLGAISGQEFRLAVSGTQQGKDGGTVNSATHIAFEAKLYTQKIDKNDVVSKIGEIAVNEGTDLWVLGATIELPMQLAEIITKLSEKVGLSILVLDWANVALPRLAVACAGVSEISLAFLKHNLNGPDVLGMIERAALALEAIRTHPEFEARFDTIKRELSGPSAGLGLALKTNHNWLGTVFADKQRSKLHLGQTLTPLGEGSVPVLPRATLTSAVTTHLQAADARILGIVGDEGCGKSWTLAQSIMALTDRPLVIVIPAREIKDTGSNQNLCPFFIERLIFQTGGTPSDTEVKRWERRFDSWRGRKYTQPNVIVCVDGLNENIGVDWPRWLDGANAELQALGGKLVFTSRRQFYNDRIKHSLISVAETVDVPEWSDQELDAILRAKDISPSKIVDQVRTSLRNPRILGIAFKLFDNAQITDFKELTVSHLLFEYIKTCGTENRLGEASNFFARRLTEHAKATLDRAGRQQTEDLTIFDISDFAGQTRYSLSAELLYASEGQFYKPQGDGTLYELSQHGLNLALGLAVVAALERIERKSDVGDKLQEILEPVEALDITADVVFSAMLASCADPEKPDAVRVALITRYLELQNTDQSLYPAFASMVRVAASAAMQAFYNIMVLGKDVANSDWLLSALREQRQSGDYWKIISGYIQQWLRLYSLDPKLAAFPHSEEEEKQKRLAETEKKLTDKLSALSDAERRFMQDQLVRSDGIDTARLIEHVFLLMSGMPLAEFAGGLVAWTFARHLNASIHTPSEQVRYLIGFNARDWHATKHALLETSHVFDAEGISKVGQWTLVSVWSAIDTEDVALKADVLVESLWPEEWKEYRQGWRLIEKYCETDPCDPSSSAPNNIAYAVNAIDKADFSQLYMGRWVTQEAHLLEDTSTGLARFAPSFVLEIHGQITNQILQLPPPAFKLAVRDLTENTAILRKDDAERLLEFARDYSVAKPRETQESKDSWISSQYALLAAMPHLSGNEQLAALLALPDDGTLLLTTTGLFVPADEPALEAALEQALASNRADTQATILAFARYSGTTFSSRSLEIIAEFLKSTSDTARLVAVQIIADLKNQRLLDTAINNGWSLKDLAPRKNPLEYFHGSRLLIEAAKLGLLSTADIIPVITPQLYGYAASELGAEAGLMIVRTLNAAIAKTLDATLPFIPPPAEENIDLKKPNDFRWLSISERDEKLSIDESFRRVNESDEEFAARQKKAHTSYMAFQEAMTQQDARLILTNMGYLPVKAAFEAAPEMVLAWAKTFEKLPEHKHAHIRNIGLAVASVISGEAPEQAVNLFDRLIKAHEFLKLTHGRSKIEFETMCVWKSADNVTMNGLRKRRLDQASSNQDIATEVNAALLAGKHAFLLAYVEEGISSDIPAIAARAVTVCGFLDENDRAMEIITARMDQKGMIGDAARQAHYAYERNLWARHWFGLMCSTDEPQTFWRYSRLFLKIVDFRYDLWEADFDRTGSAAARFEPILDDGIKKRMEKWVKKRSDKLFGMKVPDLLYLQS